MSTTAFDFAPLLRPNLPPAAVKYAGFPPFNFVGGHNDAASTPVEDLIAAATSVLKREGSTLATYGLSSGPLGYIGLRQFLSRKLKRPASVARRTAAPARSSRWCWPSSARSTSTLTSPP